MNLDYFKHSGYEYMIYLRSPKAGLYAEPAADSLWPQRTKCYGNEDHILTQSYQHQHLKNVTLTQLKYTHTTLQQYSKQTIKGNLTLNVINNTNSIFLHWQTFQSSRPGCILQQDIHHIKTAWKPRYCIEPGKNNNYQHSHQRN